MPGISRHLAHASFETPGLGSTKVSSQPCCLTGFKRFIDRLLHRGPSRDARKSRAVSRSSTLSSWLSRTDSPTITRRRTMAIRLEELILAQGGPRLGLSECSPSIYHRALGSLITNNWDMRWEGGVRDRGRAFPEDLDVEVRLQSMSAGTMPALFDVPRRHAAIWDSPLPAAEVEKVLSINADSLAWTLRLMSDTLEKQGEALHPSQDRISRHALLRSLDAVRIIQSMLRDQPDLSLRELLARYPAQVAHWRGPRPHNDIPHADWELDDTDDASIHGHQTGLVARLRELQSHAESAGAPERADRPLAAIAIQAQRWLQASGPSDRALQSIRLMGLCQAELDRTARSVDTLSAGDEPRVRRRLRLLSSLMVDLRHREGMAFRLEPVVPPASSTARKDSPIQKDRPGAGS